MDKSKIQNAWRTVKLGEVCELNPRRPKFNRPLNTPTTFVQMSAVAENGGGIVRPETRPFGEVAKGYTYFAEGDVIFAKITPCMQNGKHAIAGNLLDGIGFGSTEFHVFRPGGEIISEWILNFLLQPKVLTEATRHFTGAVGQQRVPEKVLANMEISLPPVAEQRRIASQVQKQMAELERARGAVQAQLDAAEVLPAALLRDVFTGSIARRWPAKRLDEVAAVVNGYGFSDHYQGRTGLPYPFIKVSDMNAEGSETVVSRAANTVDTEILKALGARTYPAGTVIFPKVGGALLTNKKRVLGVESTFDNNVMGVVPGEVESDWIYRWAQTIDLRTLANTQALPSIRQSVIAALKIPVPPKSERLQLATRLDAEFSAARTLIQTLETRLNEIELLPAALLCSAFSQQN